MHHWLQPKDGVKQSSWSFTMATWENAKYTRKPYQFNTSFPSQGLGIVSLVPLSEWGSINLHNAGLDEGLGSDQLIVTGIVDDINDTCLSCNSL